MFRKYYIGRISAVIVVSIIFTLYVFIGYKAYAIEPETQQAIDAVNVLDGKIQLLNEMITTPQVHKFIWGPTTITRILTINGVDVDILPIDCTDPIIPIDSQRVGASCFYATYEAPLQ